MSRRFIVLAMAASAALTTSSAWADRECFENSCRFLPAAVEPAPQPDPPQPPEPMAAAEAPRPEPARHGGMPQRRDALGEAGRAGNARASALAAAPVQGRPSAVRADDRDEDKQADVVRAGAAREAAGAFAASGRVLRIAPPAVVAVAAPAVIYPYGRPDPAWRNCQVDQRERGVVYCGPESYHPYGPYGYRPYGTYSAYRAPPIYAVAPSAKIIVVEPND